MRPTTPNSLFHHYVEFVRVAMVRHAPHAFGWSNGDTFIPRTFTLADGTKVKGASWLETRNAEISAAWLALETPEACAERLRLIAHEEQKQRVDPVRERAFLSSLA